MLEFIIRPDGDLVDFQTWDEFAELMSAAVNLCPQKLILDLVHVTRMSSNYIGSIISNHKAAQESGKIIALINVNAKLYELLQMLKLTDVMPISQA